MAVTFSRETKLALITISLQVWSGYLLLFNTVCFTVKTAELTIYSR